MLARLARELPAAGSDVLYEPKWDGFRCLAFVGEGGVELRSRNDRPFARYFPEVVESLSALELDAVLDGEIVVTRAERPDFSALLSRLHPAASRAARLAEETPATYLVFDVLAVDGDDLRDAPLWTRRERLERLLAGGPGANHVVLSPATTDRQRAEAWLQSSGAGIDGVMVKGRGDPYVPGGRTLVKVKVDRVADCVVAGFRWRGDGDGVSSLLLGLFDDAGVLHHVGVTGALARQTRHEVTATVVPKVCELGGHPWEYGFALEGGPQGRLRGAAGRWTPDLPRDWFPVEPALVAEVGYDQLDGYRFRHPSRFRHWRPDRDASSCRLDQLVAGGPE